MKKLMISALLLAGFLTAEAQGASNDSVLTGAGYADQVWYGLNNSQKTPVTANTWDIAVKSDIMSVGIFINDASGTELWKYTAGNQNSYDLLDTAGLAELNGWAECYNSNVNWEDGAFNDLTDSANQLDYGWGSYDVTTHNLNANASFVIKLSDGSYKKIVIQKLLTTQGLLIFKYADLNGTNEVVDTLNKNNYSDKNFGYYSLQNNQEINPEPVKTDWDLQFTKYTEFIPYQGGLMPYPVTGVLANEGVYISKVTGVDPQTYSDYQNQVPDSVKNVIGYDWKSYDMNAGTYVVDDSTVFFVQDRSEDIWKVVFTGFGGSANGGYYFTKEKMTTTGIGDIQNPIGKMTVYPNPSTNGQFTLAFSLNQQPALVHIVVSDMMGRTLLAQQIEGKTGLNTTTIQDSKWSEGVYYLTLTVAGKQATKKIVVQ